MKLKRKKISKTMFKKDSKEKVVERKEMMKQWMYRYMKMGIKKKERKVNGKEKMKDINGNYL